MSQDQANRIGVKGTREEGKLLIPGIEDSRLREAEEGWHSKGANRVRFEGDQ